MAEILKMLRSNSGKMKFGDLYKEFNMKVSEKNLLGLS
jgi:hypothetical protein